MTLLPEFAVCPATDAHIRCELPEGHDGDHRCEILNGNATHFWMVGRPAPPLPESNFEECACCEGPTCSNSVELRAHRQVTPCDPSIVIDAVVERAEKAEGERDTLRELIFIWGEAQANMADATCSEAETGACASYRPETFDPCPGCARMGSAWQTLQGIEGVMQEKYDELREAGYER